MNVDKMIDQMSKKLQELEKNIHFISSNKETLEKCPFHIVESGNGSRIIITQLSDLHKAREIMVRLYGKWNDKLTNTLYSQGAAIAVWRDDRHPWSIWLECPLEDFPKELLPSDSCKWVETSYKDYNLVCNS